jgi:hypothetical protein
MKRILLGCFLLLAGGNLWCQDMCDSSQCYYAKINGSYFQLRNYWPLNAILYRQQGSLDGRRPSLNVISIALNGASYAIADEKRFNEGVQFEMKYEEDKTGVPSVFTVSAQYQSKLYSIIRDSGSFEICSFKWEPDHRSFRISVEANCRMFAWGYPLDGQHEIHLEAKLSDILVAVPVWIAVTQK